MKVVVTSHCVLNQNAKLEGLAGWPGVIAEVADLLRASGCGILQMGCPEMLYEGIGRFDKSVEQYRCPAFEAVCDTIIKDTLDQIENYLRWDYSVRAILAIDGSPSCGSNLSQSAPEWRGMVAGMDWKPVRYAEGPGVLMERLAAAMADRGLSVPIIGIPEVPELGSLSEALGALEEAVS
jgi:predicted secreted protein